MTHQFYHFDLSHVPAEHLESKEFTLHIGQHKQPLDVHNGKTRQLAKETNTALALMPDKHLNRFTHFAQVPNKHIPDDRLARIKVTYPHDHPDFTLPNLAHVAIHIPAPVRRHHRTKKLAQVKSISHYKLAKYGVKKVAQKHDLVQVHADADLAQTPIDIAKTICFHHPELGSKDTSVAHVVMDDHIVGNATQQDHLNQFATDIAAQGPASPNGGFAKITASTDADGNQLTYESDVIPDKQGQVVEIYHLSDKTAGSGTTPISGAMTSVNQDNRLEDQNWTVNQGQTAIRKTVVGSPAPPAVAATMAMAADTADVGKLIWTVQEQTPHHGLSVDQDSIKFDGTTFSIDVKNTYLRTLAAYAQFLDENGDPIDNPAGWEEQLPKFLQGMVQTNPSKKYISSIPNVNVIMGIPMPTDPTTLSFVWPENATSVRLLVGGLGTSRWDNDVVWPGVILTGIFQYGIPSIFLIAGAAITSTKFFKDFVSNTDNVVAALGVAFPIVGGGVTVAAALGNTKKVLFSFASSVAGILVKKGMEKVALWVTGQVTVAELEDEVPFVGWALRAANMAIDLAQMAETTGEVLSSPATLQADVKRAFELDMNITPDPAHGEAGKPETAVWPAVSDHYTITVQYKGGTSFVQKGQMPEVTSNTPLTNVFDKLPAGGQLKVIVGIYSKTNWLCGKFETDWQDALPPDGQKSLTISGHITEMLVPLTMDTDYYYKEKIVIDGDGNHVWKAGDNPPTATLTDLDCSGVGEHLCKLVNITINGTAFQVGYTWQASGLNMDLCGGSSGGGSLYAMQNLSVLADPQSRIKTTTCAIGTQPYIAYDQFGPDPGKPQTQISQSNFYVDPRNSEFHVRQVTLDDGITNFGLQDSNLKSYGKFTIPHLDAIVVHPAGFIIGVSWQNNKMEILPIDKPVDDDKAPRAQMVSGAGVRQGLLKGPTAITVSPAGHVLVLETINERVQAFDTRGNPVPAFAGDELFASNINFSTSLDNGQFPDAMNADFQKNDVTLIFTMDTALAADLDQAKLSQGILTAFNTNFTPLTVSKDANDTSTITVDTAGSAWTITDTGKNFIYNITATPTDLKVYKRLNNVRVDVRATGQHWQLADLNSSNTYKVVNDTGKNLQVAKHVSYMPLYNPDKRTDITYLDMAVEAKGYVYILSYIGDGSKPSDYILDVYEPTGAHLFRTPNSRVSTNPQYVSTARMTVDIWRNLYTLNYEALSGTKNGKPLPLQPSISHWVPTPPLFSIPVSNQPAFDNSDLATVQQLFKSDGNINLSDKTTITTESASGLWTVDDKGNKVTYDVIRTGDGLDVYKLAEAGTI